MSDLSTSISSESIPQDGGAGMGDEYMLMALGVSCCTICFTCIVMICIIHKKSNC